MAYYNMQSNAYRSPPAGTPGWPLSPVPGWGMNPERAGPAWLALDGVGDFAPITTCPHCSVLTEGSCVTCEDGNPHPSCSDCVGGVHKPPPPPWYKSEFLQSLTLSVAVAVVSGYALHRINKMRKA
jgi:hypothetical protein